MQIADFLKQGVAWRKKQFSENQNGLSNISKKLLRPLTVICDLARAFRNAWRDGGKKRIKNTVSLIFVVGFLGYVAFTTAALAMSLFFAAFDSWIYGRVLVTTTKSEPLWRAVLNMIAAHPIIPVGGDWGLVINVILYYWIIVWIASLGFAVYEWLRGTHNVTTKYAATDFSFTAEEYEQAAQALEQWKSLQYHTAVQKYGERIVDILVLSETIYPNRFSKWERAVAINSIKEDREPRDDEE